MTERLTETAGLAGSAGISAAPPATRSSARCTCWIKSGISLAATVLLLT